MRIAERLATLKQTLNYGKDCIMTVGMCYLIAGQLQEHLQSIGIYQPIWFILGVGVTGTWFVGWLGIRIGMFAEEQRFSWDRNPAWTERSE